MNQSEFQVVVLAAGKGSRMPELTTHKPKCLLPIGGKPMVWYPLQKLQQSGFTEVILIVNDKDKNEIYSTLDKTDLNLKIDYVTITQSADEWGTADSLRALPADKIKHDLIIVSCDLITNCNFADVLHEFRKNDATLCSLYFPSMGQENIVVPGPKSKYKPERDLVGIDAETKRLVFLASSSDFEANVSIPMNTFRKHPHVKMYSNLLDSHFYVMKNWLLKYLNEHNKFSTFKGEFIPHALKQQFKHRKVEHVQKSNISELKSVKTDDIFGFHNEHNLQSKINAANAFNDHSGDMKPAYHGDVVKCYAIIANEETIGIRVNTLQTYWSINGKISTEWEKLFDTQIPLIKVDPKSESSIKSNQVDKTFVWDNVTLNEKTSFRNSILGSNTKVSSFSRVFNSIVMSNVTLSEKVVIENCIICNDVTIETNCKLKGCIIGGKQNVPADSEHANEVLVDSEIF